MGKTAACSHVFLVWDSCFPELYVCGKKQAFLRKVSLPWILVTCLSSKGRLPDVQGQYILRQCIHCSAKHPVTSWNFAFCPNKRKYLKGLMYCVSKFTWEPIWAYYWPHKDKVSARIQQFITRNLQCVHNSFEVFSPNIAQNRCSVLQVAAFLYTAHTAICQNWLACDFWNQSALFRLKRLEESNLQAP